MARDPTWEWTEGFDFKYAPEPDFYNDRAGNLTKGEWQSTVFVSPAGNAFIYFIGDKLSGDAPGQCLHIYRSWDGFTRLGYLFKSLPLTAERICGELTFRSDLAGNHVRGIQFFNSVNYSSAICTGMPVTGRISFKRGDIGQGDVASSLGSVISPNVVHSLAFDIKFTSVGGWCKIWLDGLLTDMGTFSGDTTNTADGVNGFAIINQHVSGTIFLHYEVDHIHLACWAAGAYDGDELPHLDNPVVETQRLIADMQADFDPIMTFEGGFDRVTGTTQAPGANQLLLRRFTPEKNCTVTAVRMLCATTLSTGKFKGCLYTDNAGTPDVLLSDGIEVVGITSGVYMQSNLVTPQAVVGGTQYWMGFYSDTSLTFYVSSDITTEARRVARTYTLGAPNPIGATTGLQPAYWMNAKLEGLGYNYTQVNNTEPMDISFNQSSTVGEQDIGQFAPLVTNPLNIHLVSLKCCGLRTDAGARTNDLVTRSGAVDSSGSTPGQAFGTSASWMSSYWKRDPNGNITWNPFNLNAAGGGYKVAS